jgi:hypothetical protein
MQGIYSEIHSLAQRQTSEDEAAYARMTKETENCCSELDGDCQ